MRTHEETLVLEQQACKLRRQGLSILAIASQLHVAKACVARWVHDIPGPQQITAAGKQRRMEGYRRCWDKESAARETRRQAISAEAANQIGGLTDREIMIAGAIAYWCEGSKSKPHRRADRVTFINSDPTLVRFFLRFLEVTVKRSGKSGKLSALLHAIQSRNPLANSPTVRSSSRAL